MVKLYWTFQDAENLFFVLEYCPNGDFMDLISNFDTCFPLELSRFYTAELVYILDLLHKENIVHRDLKPENLLLSKDFHLRLSDFGSAKEFNVYTESSEMPDKRERRGTFVGTAGYVSPEVLNDISPGPEADLWALGCIVYQLLVGRPPFQGVSDFLIFEQIRENRIEYPESMPADSVDFVQKLLVPDPKGRLGAGEPGESNDMQALKTHPFIHNIYSEHIMELPVPYELMPEMHNDNSDEEKFEVELLNKQDSREPEVLMNGILKK